MLKFMHVVKAKLRSKLMDPNLTVECDHDVFRYLFGKKDCPSRVPGATMLNKDDFVDLTLPSSWHCIEFPVRAKSVLRRTKKDYFLNDDGILVLSPSYVVEMATFYITKNPCSKDSM